jgi:hypothetical protein
MSTKPDRDGAGVLIMPTLRKRTHIGYTKIWNNFLKKHWNDKWEMKHWKIFLSFKSDEIGGAYWCTKCLFKIFMYASSAHFSSDHQSYWGSSSWVCPTAIHEPMVAEQIKQILTAVFPKRPGLARTMQTATKFTSPTCNRQ